jgi:hypothetical protein
MKNKLRQTNTLSFSNGFIKKAMAFKLLIKENREGQGDTRVLIL